MAEIGGWSGGLFGVSWSPDGSQIAASGTGGEVKILRCDTCGPLDEVLDIAGGRVSRELTPEERATYLPDE